MSQSIKFGAAPGIDGESHPHILTYEPSSMMTFGALFCARDLTVCYSLAPWLRHLGYVAYSIVLMLVLGFSAFPDGERGASGPACQNGRNMAMCQLNDTLQSAKVEFRFLIAFILAGYVAMSVKMWGVRRTNYAALCGNARNLSIQIASILPVHAERRVAERRVLLARWVLLAYELAVLKGKGLIDSDTGREHVANLKLLESGEWEAMVPGDRHSTVFFWINTELVRLQRAGVIEPHLVVGLAGGVAAMRAQANDLMSSLDRDKVTMCSQSREYCVHRPPSRPVDPPLAPRIPSASNLC